MQETLLKRQPLPKKIRNSQTASDYPHLEKQPKPRESQNSQIVLDKVIDDLLEKARLGEIEYKTKLKTFNGRKALIDAYQEQLDQIMYLKQHLMELDENENEKDCTQ